MKLTDFKTNELLSKFTTFKIGGPAEYFFEAKTTTELIEAVKTAEKFALHYLILGSASNILINDQGIKGLVIKNSTDKIKILPNNQAELDSGVFLPKAIFYLISQDLTGLEVFSGIPATIGGATAVQMHGVGAMWNDFVVKIKRYKNVILSVILQLKAGDPVAALAKAKTIQLNKSHQPQQSSGCIWKNVGKQSTGEIIDKQLGLKGKRIGQAQISWKHANFIENLGEATAGEVLKLIKFVEAEALKKLNLQLEREIITYE